MNKLRRLTSAVVLTLLIGLPAFAGQMDTPPCAPPVPGQMDTPPCQPAASGDTDTLAVPSVSASRETLTEVAADVLESMLSIF